MSRKRFLKLNTEMMHLSKTVLDLEAKYPIKEGGTLAPKANVMYARVL